jgi:hypothetical protein
MVRSHHNVGGTAEGILTLTVCIGGRYGWGMAGFHSGRARRGWGAWASGTGYVSGAYLTVTKRFHARKRGGYACEEVGLTPLLPFSLICFSCLMKLQQLNDINNRFWTCGVLQ